MPVKRGWGSDIEKAPFILQYKALLCCQACLPFAPTNRIHAVGQKELLVLCSYRQKSTNTIVSISIPLRWRVPFAEGRATPLENEVFRWRASVIREHGAPG